MLDVSGGYGNQWFAEVEKMNDVSAIILTYNEELHIERCIRSVQGMASRLFVVDSFSTDRTVDILRSFDVEVVQRSFKNHADQFQWGIDHLTIDTTWIMRMDADEYLDEDLQQELPGLLASLPSDVDGVYLKRKVYFDGKWIRHGGFYPHILLRIWRRGKGRVEQRWMDEHVVLPPTAKTVSASAHIVDDNLKGITFWIDKHNKYASREAVENLNLKYNLLPRDVALMQFDDPQAKRKRFLKEKIYVRLPMGVRAGLYFLYRYILRLGFLDGSRGFIWHFMQAFWYRLLVDMKIKELEERSGGDIEKMRKLLREQHGLTV